MKGGIDCTGYTVYYDVQGGKDRGTVGAISAQADANAAGQGTACKRSKETKGNSIGGSSRARQRYKSLWARKCPRVDMGGGRQQANGSNFNAHRYKYELCRRELERRWQYRLMVSVCQRWNLFVRIPRQSPYAHTDNRSAGG